MRPRVYNLGIGNPRLGLSRLNQSLIKMSVPSVIRLVIWIPKSHRIQDKISRWPCSRLFKRASICSIIPSIRDERASNSASLSCGVRSLQCEISFWREGLGIALYRLLVDIRQQRGRWPKGRDEHHTVRHREIGTALRGHVWIACHGTANTRQFCV